MEEDEDQRVIEIFRWESSLDYLLMRLIDFKLPDTGPVNQKIHRILTRSVSIKRMYAPQTR
jgi:hypothetical protein